MSDLYLYVLAHVQGADADAVLNYDLLCEQDVDGAIEPLYALSQQSGRPPARQYGDIVLRDGEFAARSGNLILVWSVRDHTATLLRHEP